MFNGGADRHGSSLGASGAIILGTALDERSVAI